MKVKNYEEWTEYYAKVKSKHICPCGHAYAAPGKVYCVDCLEMMAVSQYTKRAKMTPEERKEMSRKNGERLKRKYYEAKEKGLCYRCYKEKPIEGKGLCQRCLNKERERAKRRREVKS